MFNKFFKRGGADPKEYTPPAAPAPVPAPAPPPQGAKWSLFGVMTLPAGGMFAGLRLNQNQEEEQQQQEPQQQGESQLCR